MQLSGAPAGEKPKFSLPDFILEKSRAIEKLFLVLVILSVIAAPFVEEAGAGSDGGEIRLSRNRQGDD